MISATCVDTDTNARWESDVVSRTLSIAFRLIESRGAQLNNDLFYDSTVDIGQAIVAASIIEGQTLVVET